MKFTTIRKIWVAGILLCIAGCNEKPKKTESVDQSMRIDSTLSGIAVSNFTDTIEGKSVSLYILKNKNGLEAAFTNYGQHLVSLMVPDNKGNMADVVLGFDSLEGYKTSGKYFGSIIGRYGNRIANGRFTLDGTTYELAKNNGKNHLHGGEKGFESVVWEVDSLSENTIRFQRISPDGEEGYPGNLDVSVTYRLTDDNELKIDYYATTDKRTPVNLTNHSFFNLLGTGSGSVNTHILEVNADRFNAVDDGLIPTGEYMPVENTPFDFRNPKVIGQDLESGHPQLKIANGYDHNFILNQGPKNDDGLVFAARLTEPTTGRIMEVYTSEPGVQIYGGNFNNGSSIGKEGKSIEFRGSLCLETQHFPDSPNQEKFPNTILGPDEEYRTATVYKFLVK